MQPSWGTPVTVNTGECAFGKTYGVKPTSRRQLTTMDRCGSSVIVMCHRRGGVSTGAWREGLPGVSVLSVQLSCTLKVPEQTYSNTSLKSLRGLHPLLHSLSAHARTPNLVVFMRPPQNEVGVVLMRENQERDTSEPADLSPNRRRSFASSDDVFSTGRHNLPRIWPSSPSVPSSLPAWSPVRPGHPQRAGAPSAE